MENLIKRVHDHIVDSARHGIECRTTETGIIASAAGFGSEYREHVALAIIQLVDEGKLKCVTEGSRAYCWLVPPTWEDRPRRGYIHVPKSECDLFGLWPEPGKQIVTDDGYVLNVRSMYVDWGLEIRKDFKEVFYNPHCLSNESWGSHDPAPDALGYETTDTACMDPVPWTDKEWREALREQADDLIEGFVDTGVYDADVLRP